MPTPLTRTTFRFPWEFELVGFYFSVRAVTLLKTIEIEGFKMITAVDPVHITSFIHSFIIPKFTLSNLWRLYTVCALFFLCFATLEIGDEKFHR